MRSFKLPILNQQAEKAGEKAVGGEFFAAEASFSLISQAVRKILSNQRKAKAKARTRGEVTGSGVKIWRQKGTGRARHGDKQAPIFVGGGKAHGPTGAQNYHLSFNQKMNRKAIYAVLSQKLKEKKAFLLENLKISKTSQAAAFIENAKSKLKIDGKILFLHGPREEIKKYFCNLAGVEVLNAAIVNVYQLLRGGTIMITQDGLSEIIKEKVKKND